MEKIIKETDDLLRAHKTSGASGRIVPTVYDARGYDTTRVDSWAGKVARPEQNPRLGLCGAHS